MSPYSRFCVASFLLGQKSVSSVYVLWKDGVASLRKDVRSFWEKKTFILCVCIYIVFFGGFFCGGFSYTLLGQWNKGKKKNVIAEKKFFQERAKRERVPGILPRR